MTDDRLDRNLAALLRRGAPDAAPSREFLARLGRLADSPRRDRTGFLPLVLIAAVVLAAVAVWVLRPVSTGTRGAAQDQALPPGVVVVLGQRDLHHDTRVMSVAFLDAGTVVSGAYGEGLVFWDTVTGKEKRRLNRDAKSLTGTFAVSPDGATLALGGVDGVVRLWETRSGAEIGRLERHTASVNGLAFSPDRRHLATAANDGRLVLWELATRRVVREFDGLEDARSIVFTGDGARVMCGGSVTISAWEVATGAEVYQLEAHRANVLGLALTPDGRTLVSTDGQRENGVNRIRIWDLEGRGAPREIKVDGLAALAVAMTGDGRRFAAAGFGDMRMWDTATGRELWRAPVTQVYSLAISPDDKLVAVAAESEVRLLTVDGKDALGGGTGGAICDLAVSPDGGLVAVATWGRVVRLWDLATRRERWRRAVDTELGMLQVTCGIGGVTVCDGRTGRVLDLVTGVELRRFEFDQGMKDGVTDAAQTDDGRMLVTGHYSGTLTFVDPATGKPIEFDLPESEALGRSMIALRGRHLAVANTHLRILDLETRQAVAASERQERVIDAVAMSRDGSLVMTGERDLVRLWSGTEARPLLTIRVPVVQSVALSPDGALAACAGGSESTRIWETATGQEVLTLARPARVVHFASDGRLITGGGDSTVTVWDVRPGALPDGTLEDLWAKLAEPNAALSYGAVHRLAERGDAAVAFLGERLRAKPEITARVRELVIGLESERIEQREAAAREIAREDAESALRERLARGVSAEARGRIEAALASLAWPPYSAPAALQRVRAVQALALIKTDASKRALESLAKDSPWAAVRARAKAALR